MKKELIKLGFTNPELRVHLRPILDKIYNNSDRRATTNPLPQSFPNSEVALMTQGEFLEFRNPDEKYHSQDAYDYDTFSMNKDFSLSHLTTIKERGTSYSYYHSSKGGYIIKEVEGALEKTVGVLTGEGTLYHDRPIRFPMQWATYRGGEYVPYELEVSRTKKVKYISEVLPLVSDIVRINKESYPHLLQRIKVANEFMEIRATKEPKTDEMISLGIFNSEGLKIALAQSEWGATLFAVAEEYQGHGIGKIIGRLWYEQNPNSGSGGFTQSGKANALRIWEDRVRDFLSKGWYSELVKEDRLSQARLKNILSGLREKQPKPVRDDVPNIEKDGELRIYTDMQSSVILYDSRFLEDPKEEYIYGNVLLRDTRDLSFIYSIDYDRSHHKATTYAAFQLAKELGPPLYVGDRYGDFLELEGLSHIEQTGEFAQLKKDVIPLQSMARLEDQYRKNVDPFDELKVLILEMADSKWR